MGQKKISRREFLKFAASVPLAYYSAPFAKKLARSSSDAPGVIILVFDALSADNMSLYGYPLHIMPNLDRFCENATVYHQHYSAGTFTIPGTASLLSGLYPWSHRALSLGAGGVVQEHVEHQIFSAFEQTHRTTGYAQNKYADNLLYQFSDNLDKHILTTAFNHQRSIYYETSLFEQDAQVAFSAFDNNMIRAGEGKDASLFFGPLARIINVLRQTRNDQEFKKEYPDGLPEAANQFVLSELIDGAIDELKGLQGPSLSYFHFHPPHHPYRPTAKYDGSLFSIFAPLEKPEHPLSVEKRSYVNMRRNRQAYDEYLLSWDEEAGRLFDFFKTSGILENNYVIITSDHGELFERGEVGHFTPLIYSPVMHIPLIISRPGQKGRSDVHIPTSSVDVMPSLAHEISGQIPSWVEGQLLPGFGGSEDLTRSIYTIDAKQNSVFAPLNKFSMALTRERRRLIYYQYPEFSQFEFYDLDDDPDEMKDLFSQKPVAALQMKDEMLQKLSEVNQR